MRRNIWNAAEKKHPYDVKQRSLYINGEIQLGWSEDTILLPKLAYFSSIFPLFLHS